MIDKLIIDGTVIAAIVLPFVMGFLLGGSGPLEPPSRLRRRRRARRAAAASVRRRLQVHG